MAPKMTKCTCSEKAKHLSLDSFSLSQQNCLKYTFLSHSSRKKSTFLLYHFRNICYGYSLEAPRRGASNGYPQYMFPRKYKKIFIHLIYVEAEI